MSQAGKPGQPPDLIDVFRALTSAFKQHKKNQTEKSSRHPPLPTGRERQAPAKPAPASFGNRDADFGEAYGGEFYEGLYEKTSSVTLDDLAVRRPKRESQDAARTRQPDRERQPVPLRPAPVSANLIGLRQKLLDPVSLREAIVINELLQKPVALRRRAR